jgi:hypothetical protein
LVSLIALALLAHASFNMPYWQSVIAVVMSFAGPGGLSRDG